MDERIYDKLDAVDARLKNIDEKLAIYNEQLRYHIKRSDQIDQALSIIENRISPVENHVLIINFLVKSIAAAGGLILFFIAVFKFFNS